MKVKNRRALGIYIVLLVILLIHLVQVSSAFNNEPHRNTDGFPRSPDQYIFYHNPDLEPSEIPNCEKSDYGTHDWIADKALRLLYESDSSDWNWLLHDPTDINPEWKSNYGYNGYHHWQRSYIYFLLATQWPDFTRSSAPEVLHITHEGESISNGEYGLGTWIGVTDYHTYRYWVITPGYYIPKTPRNYVGERGEYAPQKAPIYANQFGNLAVECLAFQHEGESWAKVETGAFFLGCMSHYIADLASPAHLLSPQCIYYDSEIDWYTKSYHKWFENQLAKFTYWGVSQAGPNEDFFNINVESSEITPLPPGVAAALCSAVSLSCCFGEVGGGDESFSLPLGLYVMDEHNTVCSSGSNRWVWDNNDRHSQTEIVSGGFTREQFLDKCELLLECAVFYTACAMKWVMQEVNKRTDNNMDSDQWAKPGDKPLEEKIEVPEPDIPDEYEKESDWYSDIASDMFTVCAMLAPIMALAIAPMIVSTVLKRVLTH